MIIAMNVIINSIEPNFYLEKKILRDRNSEFFLFIMNDLSVFPFGESALSILSNGCPMYGLPL